MPSPFPEPGTTDESTSKTGYAYGPGGRRGCEDCEDGLVTDFACEVSLVVVDPEVPGDEARRWRNCKQTPLLDDLVAAAPRLRLGTIDDHFDDAPGPARRVFSLLFLRGTTPQYVAPVLMMS